MSTRNPKKQAGFIAKILFPVIAILLVVGFIYWGSDASNQTSENPVAKGVAKFYAEVRQAVKPGATRINDFTIELPKAEQSANQRLEQRRDIVKPGSPIWQGETKKRTFKENETMKTVLERFAREEGIEVIWDLQYDYIIKQHFTETGNLKALVQTIGNVVAGDYQQPVHSIYCPKERSVVLTTNKSSYMQTACISTSSTAEMLRDAEMQKSYQQERRELGN